MEPNNLKAPTENEVQEQISLYSKKAQETLKDKQKMKDLLENIKKWLGKYKNNKVFGSIIKDIIDMVDLLTDYVYGRYREIPSGAIISLVAAVIYIVSPIDLLPDWIPGVGWLDDIAIVSAILKFGLDGELKKYNIWKQANEEASEKIRAQAVLSEAIGKIGADNVLAAIFLTDDIKLKFIVTAKGNKESPLETQVFLAEIPNSDSSVDNIISLYKELLDKMDIEWSVLGKIDFMMERDFDKFDESFEISGS